jgi:hypothetical protein
MIAKHVDEGGDALGEEGVIIAQDPGVFALGELDGAEEICPEADIDGVPTNLHAGEEIAKLFADPRGAIGGAIVHDGETVILERAGGEVPEGAPE